MYRIGIDVGGTFTDLVAADAEGRVTMAKAASTPEDQSLGVMEGLTLLAREHGLDLRAFLEATDLVVHGTTVATNALLERKGAAVGMLTTEGHRDVIEMREGLKDDRFGTTVVNAYVGPALGVSLGRLEHRLREAGYARDVLIMQSHGGVAGVADSVRLAAGAVLSGPAGGIAGGRHAARLLSHGDLITFDMGGTSTDIALLHDGEPQLTGDKTVGPSKVALPA